MHVSIRMFSHACIGVYMFINSPYIPPHIYPPPLYTPPIYTPSYSTINPLIHIQAALLQAVYRAAVDPPVYIPPD